MAGLDKKSLNERDIYTKFITPAVEQAGWDVLSQISEGVYFTKGRIIVGGKLVTHGKAKFADYILYHKPNISIALIEAKDNNHGVVTACNRDWSMRRLWIFPSSSLRTATYFCFTTIPVRAVR